MEMDPVASEDPPVTVSNDPPVTVSNDPDDVTPIEVDAEPSSEPTVTKPSPGFGGFPSKSKMKQHAKSIKWEETKKLKRTLEKLKTKNTRFKAIEAGLVLPVSRKALKKLTQPIDWEADTCKVAIDLSFDLKMTLAEKNKTSKQLLRVYTLNRRAVKQIPIYFCGMKTGTELRTVFNKNDGYQHWDVKMPEETYLEVFPKEKLVYLTSDSDNVLDELNSNDVYVIGGLVDHNRYKGICFEMAKKEGIRHARLPIKEHLVMKTRDVLTIEQVFDMLLHRYNGSDWKSTLLEVVPQRKGAFPLPDNFATETSTTPAKEEVKEEENSSPPTTTCEPTLSSVKSEAISDQDQKN